MRLQPADCDDVFQTTFVALSANLSRIHEARALPKWLAVTAAREALRVKRIAEKSSPSESLQEIVAVEEASAEAAAIEAIEAGELRRGVAELDRKCRELIEALFYSDASGYAEVGERLRMPVGAIGPTRARCLERLRLILLRNGFFADRITEEAGALL